MLAIQAAKSKQCKAMQLGNSSDFIPQQIWVFLFYLASLSQANPQKETNSEQHSFT